MSQEGSNGGQSTRDFLALAHGQEWTSFYESFDKLVQDNLARSSELLRHAMSLPEVADREVAQIKEEMGWKIAAERRTAKEAFELLHKELTLSKQQGEALERSVSLWVSDLSRLSNMVNDLVQKYDAHDDVPEPAAAAQVSDPEPAVEVVAEAQETVEPESDGHVEPVAEAGQAVAESVASASDDLGWDSDIAFADVAGEDVAGSDESSSPQKPAWLSVARQS
jgi:hypothetical protein